jgi:hypothetical protein
MLRERTAVKKKEGRSDLIVGLIGKKKREPENRLPLWMLFWFLERVTQVEANAARVLVKERLAIP